MQAAETELFWGEVLVVSWPPVIETCELEDLGASGDELELVDKLAGRTMAELARRARRRQIGDSAGAQLGEDAELCTGAEIEGLVSQAVELDRVSSSREHHPSPAAGSPEIDDIAARLAAGPGWAEIVWGERSPRLVASHPKKSTGGSAPGVSRMVSLAELLG